MQQVNYFKNIQELNESLQRYARGFNQIVFLADSNTGKICFPKLNCESKLIEIPAGEEHKNPESLNKIWNALLDSGANKNTLLVAIGGGMITDIAGFASATYMRGIACLYIPTTLLAMVDAAHGGKTGIDFNGVKNLIGAFNFEAEVFICPDWLETLPERELKSGIAEVIKHYLIQDAASFYAFCEKQDNQQISLQLIKNAIEIKMQFVDKDPNDKNERKALNFGHTIGHGVESVSLKSQFPLLHGEAVAAGIVCESFLSSKRKLISDAELNEIVNCIKGNFKLPAVADFDSVVQYIQHDKKNSNTINCILLNGIGNYAINQQITNSEIKESLDYFNSNF